MLKLFKELPLFDTKFWKKAPLQLVGPAPKRSREDPKTKAKRKMQAKSRKINRRK